MVSDDDTIDDNGGEDDEVDDEDDGDARMQSGEVFDDHYYWDWNATNSPKQCSHVHHDDDDADDECDIVESVKVSVVRV